MKFEEASKEFLDYVKVTRAAGTYDVYKGKLKVLNQFFQGFDIENLDKKDIVRFWTWRKEVYENISPQTLNKYRTVIILMVEYCTDRRIQIKKLREHKKLIETIDDDVRFEVFEYLRSLEQTKEGLRNYVLFKLLDDTGLRINEALNLQVRDFNFPDNTIHVRFTKTKVERFVYFKNDTKRLIRKLISRDNLNKYLFMSYQSKKRLTVDHVQNICFRIEKKLNLPYTIRPHKFRHTFATRFLKRGGDLETLRLILGHASIKTTQRYLHLDNDYIKEQYFKLA